MAKLQDRGHVDLGTLAIHDSKRHSHDFGLGRGSLGPTFDGKGEAGDDEEGEEYLVLDGHAATGTGYRTHDRLSAHAISTL